MPKPNSKCAGCGQGINQGAIGEVVIALGKFWHKEHFLCSHCKKPLNELSYVQEGNEAYCKRDWKSLFKNKALAKCAHCNLPIQDAPVMALGQTWHKEHFVCAHCQKPFNDSKFFLENGRPYCETDHRSLFCEQQYSSTGTNPQEQQPPSTSKVSQEKAQVVHIPDCENCRNPIRGTITFALGKAWHKEHFVCAHCQKPFNDSKFFIENGRPYCEEDHISIFRSRLSPPPSPPAVVEYHVPTCESCKKPITGMVTFALGKTWHKEHFICALCKSPLNDSSFEVGNGIPYCHKDYQALHGRQS